MMEQRQQTTEGGIELASTTEADGSSSEPSDLLQANDLSFVGGAEIGCCTARPFVWRRD